MMKWISDDEIVYDSAEPVDTAGANAAAGAAGGLPNVTDLDAADIALVSNTTDESLSIGDVASQAFENLGPSAKQFATDIIQPLIHPVDTYENFKGLGRGVYQLFTPGTQPDEAKAEAVGKFFADRYGGWENIKTTMANDPVGFLSDLSVIVSGGGALVGRLPGMVGKASIVSDAAASALKKTGRAIDPLAIPGTVIRGAADLLGKTKVAAGAGKLLRDFTVDIPTHIIGMTSGTGAEALKIAAEAGRRGGEYAKAFLDHAKDKVPITEIVDIAKAAAKELRTKRTAEYLAQRQKLKQVEGTIKWDGIDNALDNVKSEGWFEGIKVRGEAPVKVFEQVSELVNEFKSRAPDQYHTPIAIDALKQAIYDIGKDLPYGSTSRRITDSVYQAVRKEIVGQFDEYGKMMTDYEDLSRIIDDVEKTMSIPASGRGTIDTALSKLMSSMRNNVRTNFGRRSQIVDILGGTDAGRNLKAALAGRAVESPTPVGITRSFAGPAALGALGGVFSSPLALAALPAFSPKLMGKAFYYAPKLKGKVTRPMYQAGREGSRVVEEEKQRLLAQALRNSTQAR